MRQSTIKIERAAFTEVYVTLRPDPAQAVEDAVRQMQASFLQAVRDEGVMVLQEKLFGPFAARDTVLSARRGAYEAAGAKPGHACSYIYGRDGDDLGGLTGGSLWGIVPAGGTTVETVSGHGEVPARLLRTEGVGLLVAPYVSGGGRGGVAEQGAGMFHAAAELLGAHGFAYRDVARTWIYLRRLLDWYDDFNRVRTAFHKKLGILGDDAAPFAASTSVQGAVDSGECSMEVLAIRVREGVNASVRPLLDSTRQGRAITYGSGFSRGMALELDGRRTVWVSGTASIDAQGRSLHVGSRDAQIVETLLNVAALVEPYGAGLRDVCTGVIYCKDATTCDAYLEVARLLNLESLPLIPVLADVCREELLVEIEAVVAVPRETV